MSVRCHLITKKNLSFENCLSINSNTDTDFIVERATFELYVSPKLVYVWKGKTDSI